MITNKSMGRQPDVVSNRDKNSSIVSKQKANALEKRGKQTGFEV